MAAPRESAKVKKLKAELKQLEKLVKPGADIGMLRSKTEYKFKKDAKVRIRELKSDIKEAGRHTRSTASTAKTTAAAASTKKNLPTADDAFLTELDKLLKKNKGRRDRRARGQITRLVNAHKKGGKKGGKSKIAADYSKTRPGGKANATSAGALLEEHGYREAYAPKSTGKARGDGPAYQKYRDFMTKYEVDRARLAATDLPGSKEAHDLKTKKAELESAAFDEVKRKGQTKTRFAAKVKKLVADDVQAYAADVAKSWEAGKTKNSFLAKLTTAKILPSDVASEAPASKPKRVAGGRSPRGSAQGQRRVTEGAIDPDNIPSAGDGGPLEQQLATSASEDAAKDAAKQLDKTKAARSKVEKTVAAKKGTSKKGTSKKAPKTAPKKAPEVITSESVRAKLDAGDALTAAETTHLRANPEILTATVPETPAPAAAAAAAPETPAPAAAAATTPAPPDRPPVTARSVAQMVESGRAPTPEELDFLVKNANAVDAAKTALKKEQEAIRRIAAIMTGGDGPDAPGQRREGGMFGERAGTAPSATPSAAPASGATGEVVKGVLDEKPWFQMGRKERQQAIAQAGVAGEAEVPMTRAERKWAKRAALIEAAENIAAEGDDVRQLMSEKDRLKEWQALEESLEPPKRLEYKQPRLGYTPEPIVLGDQHSGPVIELEDKTLERAMAKHRAILDERKATRAAEEAAREAAHEAARPAREAAAQARHDDLRQRVDESLKRRKAAATAEEAAKFAEQSAEMAPRRLTPAQLSHLETTSAARAQRAPSKIEEAARARAAANVQRAQETAGRVSLRTGTRANRLGIAVPELLRVADNIGVSPEEALDRMTVQKTKTARQFLMQEMSAREASEQAARATGKTPTRTGARAGAAAAPDADAPDVDAPRKGGTLGKVAKVAGPLGAAVTAYFLGEGIAQAKSADEARAIQKALAPDRELYTRHGGALSPGIPDAEVMRLIAEGRKAQETFISSAKDRTLDPNVEKLSGLTAGMSRARAGLPSQEREESPEKSVMDIVKNIEQKQRHELQDLEEKRAALRFFDPGFEMTHDYMSGSVDLTPEQRDQIEQQMKVSGRTATDKL